MNFTDRQKNIIRKIKSGKVYDIFSFVQAFHLQKRLQYDRSRVEAAFQQDAEVEACYCAKNLTPTPANRIPEHLFLEKQAAGTVKAENYIRLEPKLRYSCAQQEESILGETFSFNFYEGVELLTNFEELVDFLSIWQFLKEESMVLDVAQPLDKKTAGLFFELSGQAVPEPEAEKETETLEFSDRKYLGDYHRLEQIYRLSTARLQICRDFLGRRIYPAPKLNLFLQNNFRTKEDTQQFYALIAAWTAIVVSIIIAIIQYFPHL